MNNNNAFIGPIDLRVDAYEAGYEAYSQAKCEGYNNPGREGDLAAAYILKCAPDQVAKILGLD